MLYLRVTLHHVFLIISIIVGYHLSLEKECFLKGAFLGNYLPEAWHFSVAIILAVYLLHVFVLNPPVLSVLITTEQLMESDAERLNYLSGALKSTLRRLQGFRTSTEDEEFIDSTTHYTRELPQKLKVILAQQERKHEKEKATMEEAFKKEKILMGESHEREKDRMRKVYNKNVQYGNEEVSRLIFYYEEDMRRLQLNCDEDIERMKIHVHAAELAFRMTLERMTRRR